jgi:aminoglycoside phosphotransferase (APT) family kinase protein
VQLPARLLRYDRDFLLLWLDRARSLSALDRLERYDRAVEPLVSLPPTLLHGELYASNVLVAGERVCAVDWEMAASGPGVIDVAAITMGWGEPERAALTEAYRTALADPPAAAELERALDCARLHLAVQWLGWSPEWSPPPEHAQDFRTQVRRAQERLGL